MNSRLLAVVVVSVLGGVVAWRQSLVDGTTLYRGAMLVGLGSLLYLQLRASPAWGR